MFSSGDAIVCEFSFFYYFKFYFSFQEHMAKHSGDKPYKCEVCPKQFNHKTDLRRHMCLHTGEKPFACEVCGKGFIREDRMVKHADTHKKKQPILMTWQQMDPSVPSGWRGEAGPPASRPPEAVPPPVNVGGCYWRPSSVPGTTDIAASSATAHTLAAAAAQAAHTAAAAHAAHSATAATASAITSNYFWLLLLLLTTVLLMYFTHAATIFCLKKHELGKKKQINKTKQIWINWQLLLTVWKKKKSWNMLFFDRKKNWKWNEKNTFTVNYLRNVP